MPDETTIQIEAQAQQAESAIAVLQMQLQTEQRQIRRQAFLANRPLTMQEQTRLTEIAAAMKASGNALVALTFVTLQNLDDSTQVKRLRTRMNRINKSLDADLDQLKQIEGFATTAASVADTVAKVAAKVAALAAAAAI